MLAIYNQNMRILEGKLTLQKLVWRSENESNKSLDVKNTNTEMKNLRDEFKGKLDPLKRREERDEG